jgi:hypothetical protein
MKDREQIHLNNDVINKYQYSADTDVSTIFAINAHTLAVFAIRFWTATQYFYATYMSCISNNFDQKRYNKYILYSRNTFCSSVKNVIHLMFRCVSIKIIAYS